MDSFLVLNIDKSNWDKYRVRKSAYRGAGYHQFVALVVGMEPLVALLLDFLALTGRQIAGHTITDSETLEISPIFRGMNCGNKRVVVDYPDDPSYGFPDGLTIDTDGKLWVASYNAGAVFKFDPETGKTLQKVEIPAKQTTSVCWGGKNLDELYVTCARVYLSEEEFQRTQPLAGSVFKVTGLGAKGRPAYMYEG
nr:hypothetical protein BaRGS_020447 [Batillaria attramentaria]